MLKMPRIEKKDVSTYFTVLFYRILCGTIIVVSYRKATGKPTSLAHDHERHLFRESYPVAFRAPQLRILYPL